MNRRVATRRTAAAGLLVMCAGLYPCAARGQDAVVLPNSEPGIFSLRVGDLPARTLTVMVDGRSVLLPFAHLMDATGSAYGLGTGERFRSESSEGIATDTVLRQLASDSMTVQLDRDELLIIDGAAFIDGDRIAEVLSAAINVDWPTLTIRLDRAQPFPAEVAAANAQRRRTLAPARVSQGDRGVPFVPLWGGLALDWEFSLVGLDPRRNTSFSPTLSTAMWGGEMRVGATMGTDAVGDAVPVQPLASFSRVFPTGGPVRQLDVGDVLAYGVVAEQLKGFRITNSPHRQVDVFGLVPIRADLPPGWEYEVYQDGRLVGFSDAISDGAPPAAVRYGTTGVRIREIGPGGETRFRDLAFAVPFSMVPKGAMRYDLGAGACSWQACRWGAFGTVRYGVKHDVTVGGGLNYRQIPGARDGVMPHVSIAAGSTRGISGELQVERGGAGYANVQISGGSRLSFSGGGRLDRPFASVAGSPGGLRYWSSDASAVYRLGRHGLATARVTARVDGEAQRGVERWSTSGAIYHDAGTVEAGFSAGTRASSRVDLRSTYLAPRFRGGLPASLTASASIDAEGFQRADASVHLGVGRYGTITANARWERGGRRPLLEFGFSASRGGFRVQGRTSTDTVRAPHRMLVSGSGSVAWLGAAGLRARPANSGGAGGIIGRVFFDRDADGEYSSADSILAGQEVHVGGRAVQTDARGVFAAWGLPAYDVAAVKLPPSAVSPNLTPSAPERHVRPNPTRAETVNFALVTTRAVSGQLIRDVPEAQLGGLRLELRDSSGAVIETTTYEDGLWYVPRLRPGSYVVSVDESAQQAIQAVSEPVRVVVGAVGDDEIVAPDIIVRTVAGTHLTAGRSPDSVRNQALGATAPPPYISADEVQDDTPTNAVAAAQSLVVRDQRMQPGRKASGGRRADRGVAGARVVPPVRRGVLARPSLRADGGMERRGAVLHDRSSQQTAGESELPIGTPIGGGAGGSDTRREREQPEPRQPVKINYFVEDRRTFRLRRGTARLR